MHGGCLICRRPQRRIEQGKAEGTMTGCYDGCGMSIDRPLSHCVPQGCNVWRGFDAVTIDLNKSSIIMPWHCTIGDDEAMPNHWVGLDLDLQGQVLKIWDSSHQVRSVVAIASVLLVCVLTCKPWCNTCSHSNHHPKTQNILSSASVYGSWSACWRSSSGTRLSCSARSGA
jgi:hypothetical protein